VTIGDYAATFCPQDTFKDKPTLGAWLSSVIYFLTVSDFRHHLLGNFRLPSWDPG